mmetsp:Transcript_20634/g.18786  ORF Transcript_20634/g.18786 Transcript_20634/m.18786 type:complete len:430 (+) Transcript_20634:51-1340(+)
MDICFNNSVEESKSSDMITNRREINDIFTNKMENNVIHENNENNIANKNFKSSNEYTQNDNLMKDKKLDISNHSPINKPINQTKPQWRKGKWTDEEEIYTKLLIDAFHTGYLNLPTGTTLRSYLSEKLFCDPMRITKKFAGASCIGKQVFVPAELITSKEKETFLLTQNELQFAEKNFMSKLDLHNYPKHWTKTETNNQTTAAMPLNNIEKSNVNYSNTNRKENIIDAIKLNPLPANSLFIPRFGQYPIFDPSSNSFVYNNFDRSMYTNYTTPQLASFNNAYNDFNYFKQYNMLNPPNPFDPLNPLNSLNQSNNQPIKLPRSTSLDNISQLNDSKKVRNVSQQELDASHILLKLTDPKKSNSNYNNEITASTSSDEEKSNENIKKFINLVNVNDFSNNAMMHQSTLEQICNNKYSSLVDLLKSKSVNPL